jgi:hypothetical protein
VMNDDTESAPPGLDCPLQHLEISASATFKSDHIHGSPEIEALQP